MERQRERIAKKTFAIFSSSFSKGFMEINMLLSTVCWIINMRKKMINKRVVHTIILCYFVHRRLSPSVFSFFSQWFRLRYDLFSHDAMTQSLCVTATVTVSLTLSRFKFVSGSVESFSAVEPFLIVHFLLVLIFLYKIADPIWGSIRIFPASFTQWKRTITSETNESHKTRRIH